MAGFRLAPKAARARRNPWHRRRIAITGYTITYYNETGSVDNAVTLSGVDTYALGYPEVGSLANDIVVSGADGFAATFPEIGSVGAASIVDPLDKIAQGGLAFLFTEIYHDTYSLSDLSTLGLTVTFSGSDTFSSSITYVESGSLGTTSGISGVDTFNVYLDQGSIADSIIISGVDAFYSTSYIYDESGTLNDLIVISGSDVYGVPETYDEFGSIEDTILLSGADGIFYEVVIEANLEGSAQFTKSVGKNLFKTVKPKTKIRDNRFYSDLIINVSILPRISRVIFRHKTHKPHKIREELSRRS